MRYRFASGDQEFEISLERRLGAFQAWIDGQPVEFDVLDTQPGEIHLLLGERPITLYWASQGDRKWISLEGCTYMLEKPSRRAGRRPSGVAEEDNVRAPMPAQVRSVQVAEGEAVEKGQTIMVLEAMKMEIRLRAPHPGRVAHLHVQEGQQVDRGQILVEVVE